MAIDSSDFRVEAGRHVDLATLRTAVKALYKSRTNYKKQLKKHVKKLSSLQQLHYASDHWASSLIFQGMDAADKGNARFVVSQIVLDTLADLKIACPTTTPERHRELESFRSQL